VYFVGAALTFLGIDYLLATKLLFAMAIVFSGFFMYLLARRFWGKLGGVVAAIFYIYSPYFALDLYVRGALAEAWALMFIPVCIFGFLRLGETGRKNYFLTAVLAYGGLILSHNITTMLFSMFLFLVVGGYFIYLVLRKKGFGFFWLVIWAIIVSFGVTCFFWLPAIAESGLTHVKTMIEGPGDYHLHFIAFRQIWDSPWDFGGSAGIYSGLSYMIGKLHLLLTALSVFLAVYLWKKKKNLSWGILFVVFWFLAVIFMTNARSTVIWEMLPNLRYIQFPWRFLGFGVFLASFLAGAVFVLFKKREILGLVLAAGLVTGVILANKDYFRPKKYLDVTSSYYITGKNLYQWASSMSEEYLPVWRAKKIFAKPEEKVEIVKGEGVVKMEREKSNLYVFRVDLDRRGLVRLNVNYFPGWKAVVDGQTVNIKYKDDGLIKIAVKKGVSDVVISFKDRGIRLWADLISLTFIVFLSIGGLFVLKFSHE